jgi:hypothetical protein
MLFGSSKAQKWIELKLFKVSGGLGGEGTLPSCKQVRPVTKAPSPGSIITAPTQE